MPFNTRPNTMLSTTRRAMALFSRCRWALPLLRTLRPHGGRYALTSFGSFGTGHAAHFRTFGRKRASSAATALETSKTQAGIHSLRTENLPAVGPLCALTSPRKPPGSPAHAAHHATRPTLSTTAGGMIQFWITFAASQDSQRFVIQAPAMRCAPLQNHPVIYPSRL